DTPGPAHPLGPHRSVPRLAVVDEHGLTHPQGPTDPSHHWRRTMTPIVLLVGATIGAGIFVLIRAAMPTQPALSSAVERLTAAPDASQSPDTEPEGFEERLGAWAERTLTQLPLIVTPRRDLALIGWSSRTF